MLYILDQYLPVELSNKIYKNLKDEFIKDLKHILTYQIVWIQTKDKFSFLILEKNTNYYDVLLENDSGFMKKKKKKRNKIYKQYISNNGSQIS